MDKIRIEKKLVNHDPDKWYYVKIDDYSYLTKGTIITNNNYNVDYCIETGNIYYGNHLCDIENISEIREATTEEISMLDNKIKYFELNKRFNIDFDPNKWYYYNLFGKEWYHKGNPFEVDKNITTGISLKDGDVFIDKNPLVVSIEDVSEMREVNAIELERIANHLNDLKKVKIEQEIKNPKHFELFKKKVRNTIKRLYEYNQATIDLEQPLEVMGVKMTLDYWQFDLIVEFMSYAISNTKYRDVFEEIHQYIGFDYDIEATEDFVDNLFNNYYNYHNVRNNFN